MPSKQIKAKPFQFSFRELLLCLLIAGLCVGWLLDRTLLNREFDRERRKAVALKATMHTIRQLAQIDATTLPVAVRDTMWSDVMSGKIVGQPKSRYEPAFATAIRVRSSFHDDIYEFDLTEGTNEGLGLYVYVSRTTGEIAGFHSVSYPW